MYENLHTPVVCFPVPSSLSVLYSIFLAFIPILTITGVLLYIWLWWVINDRLKPFYSLVNAVCIDGVLIIRNSRSSNPLTHVLGISSHHMLQNTFHMGFFPPTCIFWEIHRFVSHPPNVMMKFTHRSQQVSLVCVLFTAALAHSLRIYLLNTNIDKGRTTLCTISVNIYD